MFENMMRRAMYYDNMRRHLAVLPQTAETIGEKSCQRSGRCCWIRPCALGPGDPERIAAHLGITPRALFAEYLVVDEIPPAPGLRLLPRRGEQSGGAMLTAAETFDSDSPCVFLNADHTCRVHEVKPVGGRQFGCWMTEAEKRALPQPTWSVQDLESLGYEHDGGDW